MIPAKRSGKANSPGTRFLASLPIPTRGKGRHATSSPLLVAIFTLLAFALAASPAAAATPTFCPGGTTAGKCESAAGVAVDQSNGTVYVADEGNARIDVFDSEGNFQRAFGFGVIDGAEELQVCTTSCQRGNASSRPGAVRPMAVAVDPSTHDVYAVDRNEYRIEKFTSSGEFLLAFGKEVNKTKVAAHAPEAEQDVCTKAEIEAGDVCGAGTPGSKLLGNRGAGPGVVNAGVGFNSVRVGDTTSDGTALSVDEAGDVWLGDSERLERFSSAGEFLSELPLPGFGTVVSLAAAPAGDFYALATPVDEMQEIIPPTSGTYTITFEGQTTAPLPFNAKGEKVQAALRSLSTLGENVVDLNLLQSFRRIGFVEALAYTNVPPLEVSAGSVVTIKQGTPGTLAKLGPAGEVLQTLDASGSPNSLAFDTAGGNLFVSDQARTSQGGFSGPATLFEYTSSGTLRKVFGTGGVIGGPTGNALAFDAVAQRLYVVSSEGGAQAFAIPPDGPLPEENSEKAEPVAKTTATLRANVNPEGKPTTVHFEYVDQESFEKEGGFSSPKTKVTAESASVGEDFSGHPVSVEATGLSPGVSYRFRLVATNERGVVKGEIASFTTLPPLRIDDTFATEVSASSATLITQINPLGDLATYRFEYLTDAEYDANLAVGTDGFSGANVPTSIPDPNASVGSGNSDVTLSVQLQGLSSATAYRYRVIAFSAIRPAGIVGPLRSFTTQGAATAVLPDGRQWEMVSPPQKHGAPLEPITEEGGVIEAAAGGGAITYVTPGPLGPESAGTRSPAYNQLLSRRSLDGWSTHDITTPTEEVETYPPGHLAEYKFFSEDLSVGLVDPVNSTPLSPQATEETPYRREANGEYVPLITAENVPPETEFGNQVYFETATPDFSHVLLNSSKVLSSGFTAGFKPKSGQSESVYELSGGAINLVSILPNGQPTAEAGLRVGVGYGNEVAHSRGAISDDGNRVFFTAGSHLYVRDVGLEQTVLLDEIQPGAQGGSGAPVFEAASTDGSKVFFTDASRLTTDAPSSSHQPELYMCEVTVSEEGEVRCKLSDLSVGSNLGEAANVEGQVSAIDAAGKHVFFAANGVLTHTPNAQGEEAIPGTCCNLYDYDTVSNQVRLVAVLSHDDDPDWAGKTNLAGLGNLTARVSPNGRYFTFMSQRSLTGYDNRDAKSGEPDEEVFLFDSENGKLSCASCNPTGARPQGVFDKEGFPGLLVDHASTWGNKNSSPRWLAASIPGWTQNQLAGALYQSRYLSNSGRLFFTAADALVPKDTNGVMDVYQYEPPEVGDCTESSPTFGRKSGGCVALISSGTSPEESTFLDASKNGDEAFFLTASKLSSSDIDTALDVYDAHVCSAESPCPPPPPPPPPACAGDACQLPATPPHDPPPGSLSFHGAGNVHETKTKKRKRAKKRNSKAKSHKRAKHNRRAGR